MKKDAMVPPNDLQAEQAVLGAIMLDPLAMARIGDTVTAKSFYQLKHQEIFKILQRLSAESKPTDIISLSEAMGDNRDDYYLTELVSSVPFPRQVEYHAKLVQKKFILREMINMSERVQQMAFAPDSESREVEEFVMDSLLGLKRESESGFVGGDVINTTTYDYLEKLQKSSKAVTGIDTGYKMLNKLTLGFQPGDLIILAARPSMGKTALAVNLALNMAQDQYKVGIASLEQGSRQLWLRMASIASGVEYYKLRQGYRNIDIADILTRLQHLPIWIDDSRDQSANTIRSRAKLLALKGLDILFVDYLQIITQPDDRQTENYKIGLITRQLRMLAKELDIPVVLLSQLSRKPEDRTPKAPRPKISDLRDSGNIEQNADIVMLLYRQSWYDRQSGKKPENNEAELTVAKNREGATGRIRLAFIEESLRFADMEREIEQEYASPEPERDPDILDHLTEEAKNAEARKSLTGKTNDVDWDDPNAPLPF